MEKAETVLCYTFYTRFISYQSLTSRPRCSSRKHVWEVWWGTCSRYGAH